MAWHGREGQGIARHIMERKFKAWYGKEWHGMTRQGNEKHGMERNGMS
jgi:hypothetical protein